MSGHTLVQTTQNVGSMKKETEKWYWNPKTKRPELYGEGRDPMRPKLPPGNIAYSFIYGLLDIYDSENECYIGHLQSVADGTYERDKEWY